MPNPSLIFPIISDSPSLLIKIVGDSTCIMHIRNEVLRNLKTPIKRFVSIMSHSQVSQNGHFVEHLFISFKSERDLKESVTVIERTIREVCRDEEIDCKIVPYIKYGVQYISKEWPTIYYEPSIMETTTIPVDVILNMFKTMIRILGPGSRALFLELGIDNGRQLAILLKESIETLIASKNVAKIVDALFRTLLHFGYIFEQQTHQENGEIIIRIKPRIVNGETYKVILDLIMPLTRYYYGVLYGVFEKVGLEPKIEINPNTGKIDNLKVKIKELTKEYEYTIKIVPEENVGNSFC